MTKIEALKLAQQGANYSGRRQVVLNLNPYDDTWIVREINGELRTGEIGVQPAPNGLFILYKDGEIDTRHGQVPVYRDGMRAQCAREAMANYEPATWTYQPIEIEELANRSFRYV